MTNDELITSASNYLLDKVDEDLHDYIVDNAPEGTFSPQTEATDDLIASMVRGAVLEAITELGITPEELDDFQSTD